MAAKAAQPAARIALVAAVAALAAGSCYRPNIAIGGFACNLSGGKKCPDDFVCSAPTGAGVCVKNVTDGGAGKDGGGGQGGGGGKGGTGGGGGAAGAPPVCFTPLCPDAGADAGGPDGGLCDPVCQTGCSSCYDKCSVDSSGALICTQPTLTNPPTAAYGDCEIQPFSGGGTTDNCEPGQGCVPDSCANASPRCFPFCRTASDCAPGVPCLRNTGAGTLVCDVPLTNCDPILVNMNGASVTPGCPHLAQSCYISDTVADGTVCDCEARKQPIGSGRSGETCATNRDCLGGLACADPDGSGLKCYTVCRMPGKGVPESGEQACAGTCQPFVIGGNMSQIFGYCF